MRKNSEVSSKSLQSLYSPLMEPFLNSHTLRMLQGASHSAPVFQALGDLCGSTTMPLRRKQYPRFGSSNSNCLRSFDAQLAKVAEHAGSPAIDVMFHHLPPHSLHAHAAFRRAHLQRAMDCVRHTVDIIWVHDQRISQLH